MATILFTLLSCHQHQLTNNLQQDNRQGRLAKELLLLVPHGLSPRATELITEILQKESAWAITTCIQSARVARTDVYWPLMRAIQRKARESSAQPIVDAILSSTSTEVDRDLIPIIATLPEEFATPALRRLLRDAPTPIKALAIDQLAELGARDAWKDLLDLLPGDPAGDGELTRRIGRALRALARQTPPGTPGQWMEWATTHFSAQLPPEPTPATKKPTSVVETLGRLRITAFEDLLKRERREILVIEGGYDKVQDVLAELRIPCTTISSEKLLKGVDLEFTNRLAVIVNCGTGDWPPAQVQRIRKFVSDGGYLLTTDLGLPQVVKHAFPGIYDPGKSALSACTPEILPARGSLGHPLHRGSQFSLVDPPEDKNKVTWVIDDSGPSMSFNWNKAILLAEAPELHARKKPTGVAVTFPFGGDENLEAAAIATGGTFEELRRMKGGKVLCLLSHLYRQTTAPDGFTLQNLIINFLLEARDRQLMREEARKQAPEAPPKASGKGK